MMTTPVVFFCLVWIAIFLVPSGAGATQVENPERCFLYHAGLMKNSPPYHLLDDHDSYVTLNHYNSKWEDPIRIVDENGTCIIAVTPLMHDGSVKDCQKTILGDGEYTTLRLLPKGKQLIVQKELSNGYVQEWEVESTPKTLTIVIESYFGVNVAFDCRGYCYQFENTALRMDVPTDDKVSHKRIYGKIDNATKAKSSRLYYFGNGCSSSTSFYLHELLIEEEQLWFPIDISLTSEDSDHCFSNYSIQNSSSHDQPNSLRLHVSDRNTYGMLSFFYTSGMRWAVFCDPEEELSPSRKGTTFNPEQNSTSLTCTHSVLIFIVLTFCNCMAVMACIAAQLYFKFQKRMERENTGGRNNDEATERQAQPDEPIYDEANAVILNR